VEEEEVVVVVVVAVAGEVEVALALGEVGLKAAATCHLQVLFFH
jgi:hypothetical protein